MDSHVYALSLIQLLRSLLGLAGGVFLVYRSFEIPLERIPRLEATDRAAFAALGIVVLCLALFRGVHAALLVAVLRSSRVRRGGPLPRAGRLIRRLGIALAVIDLIDLTAFPITTACGTYGLLVHSHPEARDLFEGVFSRSPAG